MRENALKGLFRECVGERRAVSLAGNEEFGRGLTEDGMMWSRYSSVTPLEGREVQISDDRSGFKKNPL